MVTQVVQRAILPSIIPSLSISQFASSVGVKVATLCAAKSMGAAMFRTTPAQNCATAITDLRGGAASKIDLDRVDLRLNSLEEYCVIASIILGAVIGMFYVLVGWSVSLWLDPEDSRFSHLNAGCRYLQ